MPIYEYGCRQCGEVFEELQQFSDPPPEACPECGDSDVSRLVSRSSFHLQGGGWYADDYSSTSGGANDTSPADSTSSASSETNSETTSSSSDNSGTAEAAAE